LQFEPKIKEILDMQEVNGMFLQNLIEDILVLLLSSNIFIGLVQNEI